MQASAINSSNSVLGVQKPSTHGFNDLSGEDFFSLLIAQLQSQDPLKPTDNQQLLSQISGIRQMEQSSKLNSTLDSLASQQQFGSVSGLIGHYIAGSVKDSAGNSQEIQGLVIGCRFENGRGILELHNGKSIPAENVEQVTLVDNLPPDILAQLQQELGQTGASGGTGATTGTPPANARPIGLGTNVFHTGSDLHWGQTAGTSNNARAALINSLIQSRTPNGIDVDDE